MVNLQNKPGFLLPLLLQKNIADSTALAVWKIEEEEDFFLEKIQLKQVIHHPHKRLQHLAGRYVLSLLQPYFPHDEIQLNEAGKPYLPSRQYQFSISHCGDCAAVIISAESRCGIDIELFSAKTGKVKDKYLGEEEQAYLHSLQNLYNHLSLYQFYTLCWCAKEAVYKWWGNGKLDFKKNMKIQSIGLGEEIMNVDFAKDDINAKLILQFQWLDEASLVWLVN